MVNKSVSVWVGCWCPPSPALITGILDFAAATIGAPSFGCLMAQMSAKQDMVRMVSDTLSPFAAEEELAEAKPSTCPPRLNMADSKLKRVLVLGS